jgi:predicted metal-dependent hydrolase
MLIEIADISIEVTKKRIKNMHLRIYPPDGTVKVSAPLHYKEHIIREFITEKYPWIEAQRKRIQERGLEINSLLKTGSLISFKGNRYILIIHEHYGPTHIKCHEGFIYCYLPPTPTQIQINNVLDSWYKREMSELLPDLIKRWEPIIGVHISQWGIRKMKTRWGSCNIRARRIWLNLNLIKKPLACLEYVLVHELVHLHEARHNHRFYQLMDQFLPQWREYDYLLEGKKTRK